MKNDRTVWIKFVRTTTKIIFVGIIAVGSIVGIKTAFTIRSFGSDFIPLTLLWLLGLPAVSVLVAFLTCGTMFIKLDMAEDIHALRKKVCDDVQDGEKEDDVDYTWEIEEAGSDSDKDKKE